MNSILVTGGCGFIGANFIRHWINAYPAARVINVDLLTYAGNPANLADLAALPNYAFIHADIADAEAMAKVLAEYAPDAIVNFAAESHNSRAINDPGAFFRTNVLGTQVLLEAARQAKTPRFHHISTCEVFGDLALEEKDKFREDYPYRPRTPYNASKAAADHAVRAYYHTYQLPITISICANNYGPYQFPEKLIPHFATRLMRGDKMPLYQSSRNRREWLHVQDHCRAVERVLLDGAIGETYNVGSEIEMDIEEVADRLLAIFNLDDSHKVYVPDRPSHDRRYLLDAAKIRRDLGWEAEINLEKGFADTVAWYRDNESWWAPLVEQETVNESGWQK